MRAALILAPGFLFLLIGRMIGKGENVNESECCEYRLQHEAQQRVPGAGALLDELERLRAENERLRAIVPEVCPYCGGRMDINPMHLERCFCLPVIRGYQKDIKQLVTDNARLLGELAEAQALIAKLERYVRVDNESSA